MTIERNIVLDADSYKGNMFQQYQEGTEYVYTYAAARAASDKKMVFFGLLPILQSLTKQITAADVAEAKEEWAAFDKGFNFEGWMRIVDKHNGYLPLRICAVEEGTVLDTRNVLFTIVNTDPEFYWLPTWVETAIQRVWYTTSVATRSYRIREDIKKALVLSGDVSGLPYKLHEMGSRSTGLGAASALAAMAHLTAFDGTDTIIGAIKARKIYGGHTSACTIPAMEHSTITSWGRQREFDAYMNMYNLHLRNKPEGMCSIVMDSYDILNAIEGYAKRTKDFINDGGITVIRIDSGNPETLLQPIMNVAAANYSYHVNDKGYKVFDKIRFIWSDGVAEESIQYILSKLISWKWSADNFAYGVGGYLVQRIDRDTFSFAMKASATVVDGKDIFFSKDPVTASYKKSFKGYLSLVNDNGIFKTTEGTMLDGGLLKEVFLNGQLVGDFLTFDQICAKVRQ